MVHDRGEYRSHLQGNF